VVEACGKGCFDHYDRSRSQAHRQSSAGVVGAGRSKGEGRYQPSQKRVEI
jgi:hypothetical protein